MPKTTFSDLYVNRLGKPEKAARYLATRERRLAELEAGAAPRIGEDIEQVRSTVERYAKALRDEGRCRDCGKKLTDPESVARGIGPDCWSKRHAPAAGMTSLLDDTDADDADGGAF